MTRVLVFVIYLVLKKNLLREMYRSKFMFLPLLCIYIVTCVSVYDKETAGDT